MVACILGTTRSAFSIRSRHVCAEPFVLGNGADRVDVLLDIRRNELAVATHAALQVDKVVGVADGADALGDLLALRAEALVLLASRLPPPVRPAPGLRRLWGAAWAALCRRVVGVVAGALAPA